jgi:prevent-host-death family protein
MAMTPIDEAKQRLQDLIDAVSQSHQPIVINSQNSNAILLSEANWLAIQETLYLVSIPGMRESIRAGLATSIDECDWDLEW